ncbi:TSUP family transporter [Aliiroseovarius sp. YM-037]|uniref:TSUP family transporter n=1 Tax=Aliiroseovarius sp. YM-037 TaxID=3341728 RepID=UPI003A80109B
MPDFLSAALATPGLGWLILAISTAGIVRGFTGFGSALIFVPVAGQFLPPAEVILVISTTGIASTCALVPRAWGQAHRSEVALLAGAAILLAPFGIWAMTHLDELTVRWIVGVISAITLTALMTGWRYRGGIRPSGLAAIGATGGVVGGMTGLTGPVVILFYLASDRTAQIIRANTILFLAALDLGIIVTLFSSQLTDLTTIVIGAILAVPYFVTTMIGQALFRPGYEKTYRWAAYAVIAVAVLTGLPLFD